MTASRRIAEHLVYTSARDIAPAQRIQARQLILDYLGVAVAGSATPSGRIVGEVMEAQRGPEESTVLGRGVRLPAPAAAYANAVSDHSIELDDVDDEALFHFGPPVVSAALAVAEQQKATGAETVAAVALGCEVMARISRATNPALRNRGFHTTPTCGVFAATAAAARILSLDVATTVNALGIAGAHSGGLMEMYGPSMQKRINPAPAARDGVIAAQLAAAGYTGADTIFEGERGFGAAFAGGIDTARLLEGLGDHDPAVVEYKPYSAARPIHNAVDCARQLRHVVSGDLAEVEDITVWRHPDWADYHGNLEPGTFHEAQVSLPYSVAVAIRFDAALPEHYAPPHLHDETIRGVARRVRTLCDPELARGVSCRMSLRTRSGREEVVTVDHPLGSQANPMGEEALRSKFFSLAGSVVTTEAAQEAARLVDDLEDLESVAPLMGALAGGGA